MNYDILIVGGGMVGASLACALGDSPLRVGVIESHKAEGLWPRKEYDIRVSAITRATQQLFEQIGAWEGMCQRRVSPYYGMHVWDATGSGAIDFDCANLAERNLGHIIENSVIHDALLERMGELPNVELIAPAKVTSLTRLGDRVELGLEGGQSHSATLLVGADGANSWVRQQAGISSTGWSYQQSAVVATIKTSQHHQGIAYQRFMPNGPLAFLPMPEGLSSIVWSTTPEQASELAELPEEAFLEALQGAFGDALGKMESTGSRGVFPLLLRHANRYVDERLALIGNAAHAIHPLAGQGLNLGATDVAALTEVLTDTLRQGNDIGEYRQLRRYERWRKADNVSVMAAMDGFKRLFSNDNAALSLVRNLGLTLTNYSGPIKDRMIRRAMGLEGDLPRLSRGLPLEPMR